MMNAHKLVRDFMLGGVHRTKGASTLCIPVIVGVQTMNALRILLETNGQNFSTLKFNRGCIGWSANEEQIFASPGDQIYHTFRC